MNLRRFPCLIYTIAILIFCIIYVSVSSVQRTMKNIYLSNIKNGHSEQRLIGGENMIRKIIAEGDQSKNKAQKESLASTSSDKGIFNIDANNIKNSNSTQSDIVTMSVISTVKNQMAETKDRTHSTKSSEQEDPNRISRHQVSQTEIKIIAERFSPDINESVTFGHDMNVVLENMDNKVTERSQKPTQSSEQDSGARNDKNSSDEISKGGADRIGEKRNELKMTADGANTGNVFKEADANIVKNQPTRSTFDKDAVSDSSPKGAQAGDESLDHWFQQVGDSEVWVYSAHYDHVAAERESPQVVVYGLANETLKGVIRCLMSDDKGNRQDVDGWLQSLPDSHKMPYPACSIRCLMKDGFRPQSISLTYDESSETTGNNLTVEYPSERRYDVSLCYSVLHSNFSSVSQLITSVEYNLMLGVEHFYLYNNSLSPQAERAVRHYQALGVLTVLLWSLPPILFEGSWYFGQMAALNDCLYRNRNRSRLLVFMDTDEMLVPLQPNPSISSLWNYATREAQAKFDEIEALRAKNQSVRFKGSVTLLTLKGRERKDHPRSKGGALNITSSKESVMDALIIRSAFFDPSKNDTTWTKAYSYEFEDDNIISNDTKTPATSQTRPSLSKEEKSFIDDYKILPFSRFKKSPVTPDRSWFDIRRSKYIARPEMVYMAGVHHPGKVMERSGLAYASERIALIHHYREPVGLDANADYIYFTKFKDSLLPKVMNVIEKLKISS